jgi:predicted dehydrogenase
MTDFLQHWPRPSRPRPIVIIGAGGIVRSGHLPAYGRLHYPLAGLYDINPAAAAATADAFKISCVFPSLPAACAVPDAVFDLAVPGDQVLSILDQLPSGAPVLIQKPMGRDLADARAVRATAHARQLVAAVNFQLRFSPNVLALHDLVARGALGTIVDLDVRIVIDQPWHLWVFLERSPRLEILYHSIHYLDTIRWLIGEPAGAYCRTVAHPDTPKLRDTRSSIILDYGDRIRCSLVMNHTHRAGPEYRASQLTVEGLRGAARLTWGVNLSYPSGPADTMELALDGKAWEPVSLRGSWFTEAFEGPMSNLQRFAAGEDAILIGSVDDAIKTMALVEACYESSLHGSTPVPSWE